MADAVDLTPWQTLEQIYKKADYEELEKLVKYLHLLQEYSPVQYEPGTVIEYNRWNGPGTAVRKAHEEMFLGRGISELMAGIQASLERTSKSTVIILSGSK